MHVFLCVIFLFNYCLSCQCVSCFYNLRATFALLNTPNFQGTLIGMPHVFFSCAALYCLPQVLLGHYFFYILAVNLFVHVYMP